MVSRGPSKHYSKSTKLPRDKVSYSALPGPLCKSLFIWTFEYTGAERLALSQIETANHHNS